MSITSKFSVWNVFCLTENILLQTCGYITPTQCPNGHPIDTNQTTLIDYKLMSYDKSNNIIVKNNLINNITFTDLQSNFFFNSAFMKSLATIKVICNVDSIASPATLQVFDFTNQKFIGTLNITNTDVQTLEFDVLQNLPENDALFEFSAKVSNKKGYVNIKSIIICYN